MKKNLLVILLATFTAGSMLADDGGGFLHHLGSGIGEIVESPAHIGQGGKTKKERAAEERKRKAQDKKDQQDSKRRRAKRRAADERD